MSTNKTETLVQIAKSIKMTAKNARAKLRRAKVPAGLTVGDSWTFNTKGAAWARKLLKTDLRKSA